MVNLSIHIEQKIRQFERFIPPLPTSAKRIGMKKMRRGEPLFIRTSRQLINQGVTFEEIKGLTETTDLIGRALDDA
jgi:hypothetical protein